MVEYNFVLLGLFPLFPGHVTGHRKGGRGPVIIILNFFGNRFLDVITLLVAYLDLVLVQILIK